MHKSTLKAVEEVGEHIRTHTERMRLLVHDFFFTREAKKRREFFSCKQLIFRGEDYVQGEKKLLSCSMEGKIAERYKKHFLSFWSNFFLMRRPEIDDLSSSGEFRNKIRAL